MKVQLLIKKVMNKSALGMAQALAPASAPAQAPAQASVPAPAPIDFKEVCFVWKYDNMSKNKKHMFPTSIFLFVWTFILSSYPFLNLSDYFG